MAKTARRFIASDPSPPTYSFDHHNHKTRTQSVTASSTSPTTTKTQSTQVDPLRSFYSTPKFANHASNSTSNNENSRTAAVDATVFNSTILDRVAAERARIRMEFFATYDVMTGVRIAATLGGFFGLMVFLVVYKSRGESQETLKALKDPKIAAVAAAVMQEEEDRELQEAMEATGMSIYPDEYDHIGFQRGRLMSLGNVSAPPMLSRNYRFSSIGSSGSGYSSLIGPHRRFSYAGCGRKTASESCRILSAYPMGGSFGIDDYFVETDGDEADDEFDQLTTASVDVEKSQQAVAFLSVPPKGQESRRSSNITCCSTESSYLERRCSALTLGLPPMPPISCCDESMAVVIRRPSSETWDYYYPGIHVIQPTPRTSPCRNSESSINTNNNNNTNSKNNGRQRGVGGTSATVDGYSNQRENLIDQDLFDCITEYSDSKTDIIVPKNSSNHNISNTSTNRFIDTNLDSRSKAILRRAPLASLSSFKISSVDYQDSDLRSLGSDSVFAESYADTDDDMEQFSTDSDEISDAQSPQKTCNFSAGISIGYTSTTTTTTTTAQHQSNQSKKFSSSNGRGNGEFELIDQCQSCTTAAVVPPNELTKASQAHYEINDYHVLSHNDHQHHLFAPSTSPIAYVAKSNSLNLVNTFETKAIIERHHGQSKSTGCPNWTTKLTGTATLSSSSSSSSTAAPAPTNSDNEFMTSLNEQQKYAKQHHQHQRPASYSGCETISNSIFSVNSLSSLSKAMVSTTHSNISTITTITTPLISTIDNAISTLYTTSNIVSGSTTIVRTIVPSTYSSTMVESSSFVAVPTTTGTRVITSTNATTFTSASDCADVAMDHTLYRSNNNNISPSVILELPVISTQDDEKDQPIDPCLPGPSRKWSKETLF